MKVLLVKVYDADGKNLLATYPLPKPPEGKPYAMELTWYANGTFAMKPTQ